LGIIGGVAYAVFSATGTGAGGAKAVDSVVVTVTASTGTADLFPSNPGGAMYFTLTNTNPYPVTFTAMSVGPGPIVSSDDAACAAANVSADSATGLNLPVAANTTSPVLSIANVVHMAAGATDGCQGKTFTIPLTLTGSQSSP
jgi:hypothetical protein